MFDDSSSSDEDDVSFFRQRRLRVFRPRINFDLCHVETVSRFRLSESDIDILLNALHPLLLHPTLRNMALSPKQQLLVAIRFLATGDNLATIGDAHGIHKSTVSRVIRRVVSAINSVLYFEYVKWPEGNETWTAIKTHFRNVPGGGIPTVCGCIDGTYVNIKRPKSNEVQFVNRHGSHSLNVLLLCGPQLEFFYANPKFPGSVSDARVFRKSGIFSRFESGWRPFPNAVILGDSIYPCNNYLIPPLPHPCTDAENRFNTAHKKTRRLIECAIGLLKQRFRCLLFPIEMSPTRVAEIVMTCVTLHNVLLRTRFLSSDELESLLTQAGDPSEVEQTEDLRESADIVEVNPSRRMQLVSIFRNNYQ